VAVSDTHPNIEVADALSNNLMYTLKSTTEGICPLITSKREGMEGPWNYKM
jgi:hypothetical protein